MPEPEEQMDTAQAAQVLGVSVRRIRAMIKAGRLEATHHETPNKIGYWTVTQSALEAVRERKNGRPRQIRADEPEQA